MRYEVDVETTVTKDVTVRLFIKPISTSARRRSSTAGVWPWTNVGGSGAAVIAGVGAAGAERFWFKVLVTVTHDVSVDVPPWMWVVSVLQLVVVKTSHEVESLDTVETVLEVTM